MAYLKLKSELEYSLRILSISIVLSIIGILSGIISVVFEGIWIYVPDQSSIFILIMSSALLATSLFVYKNTRKLTKAVRTVNIEA